VAEASCCRDYRRHGFGLVFLCRGCHDTVAIIR
jgi:hypothetical protein